MVGRPPIGPRFETRLPQEAHDALAQMASDAEMTLAELGRDILVAAVLPTDPDRTFPTTAEVNVKAGTSGRSKTEVWEDAKSRLGL